MKTRLHWHAECDQCDWEVGSRGAQPLAAEHARKTGHTTRGEVSVHFEYKQLEIGTEVVVTRDDGTEFQTKTRSPAWRVCGEDVIMVDGITGCYSLERVQPVN